MKQDRYPERVFNISYVLSLYLIVLSRYPLTDNKKPSAMISSHGTPSLGQVILGNRR
ncbi:hypothetical protein BO86DRAFT_389043 [Aspergillus japonicus CBS 114.51]|uniref:Uncharacterized protein n=1 Tax=Aspergillus japonicus CBS 114.51 TaxID=1448312 RepID=A0A8T8X1W9_ASPJA|nr:hypothetical protein BO86DRAFT_389043 [Aspergillus japonicus CBS 114.51]RAH82055.1 hypothetical protein BO86DRAFT_389043 [Aspergillus japonicus CBS 114.51]